MKRKLALLLAAAMTVAAVPMNLFAAASVRVTTAADATDYTLYYDPTTDFGSGTVDDNRNTIEYYTKGGEATLTFDQDFKAGDWLFTMELSNNAAWFMRTEDTSHTITPNNTDDIPSKGMTVDAYIAQESRQNAPFSSDEWVKNDFTKGTGLPITNGKLAPTFNPNKGFLKEVSSTRYTYYAFGDASGSTPYVAEDQTNNIEQADPKGTKYVAYRIEFDTNYKRVADVYLMEDVYGRNPLVPDSNAAEYRMEIPMVFRTDGNDDETNVSVSITDAASGINKNTGLRLASFSAGGRTNTYVRDPGSSRYEIKVDDLIINELKVGTLKQGKFQLIAPSGYYWGSLNNVKYDVLGDLKDRNTSFGTANTDDMHVTFAFDRNRNTDDNTVIIVDIEKMNKSVSRTGSLVLSGLYLYPDDEDNVKTGNAVNARIKDTGDKIVTDQSFKVGDAKDYTVALTVVDKEIPELVSGRLESPTEKIGNNSGTTNPYGNWAAIGKIEDDYHKAARVKFAETLADAWWAKSSTVFLLPEGVKFLKVEFDDLKKFDESNDNVMEEGEPYYNTHARVDNVVTINDNKMTLQGLYVKTDDKSSFEMDIWVNSEVSFEGDIDLTLSNYGTRVSTDEMEQSVTIAKTIVPIEVETKVSDVKIGYQYVSVADFDIIETKAGNLLKGYEVRVSVTDEISTDLAIAPGFAADVTDGDMKISGTKSKSSLTTSTANTSNSGHIFFTIDRASKDEASTVSFTNVLVKIDRTVPYSNPNSDDERGINLIVWGEAVARNYEGIGDSEINTTSYDYFSTPGVRAKYINVTSSPDDLGLNFTNVVEVTIGNVVAKVNGEDYTMPVAAYISEASNSTMIPLRFVAYALGLAEEKVIWDGNNGTITVDAGSRSVQFQVGNTNFLREGMSIPMLSPEGLPVAAEIRDERSFVPFRALGEAFNIIVDWEPTTSTAIYNKPAAQ